MLVVLVVCLLVIANSHDVYNEYPSVVPKFAIRRDIHSGRPVSTGLLHLLSPTVTLAEFQRYLQCVDNEPNFDYNSGMVSFLKSMPPTRESLEVVCSRAEKHCSPWKQCQQQANKFKAMKNVTTHAFAGYNTFSAAKMFRILKGRVYYDWPWGVERFLPKRGGQEDSGTIAMIRVLLDRISDVGDSVFMLGGEQNSLSHRIPLMMFSPAPAQEYLNMPWHWGMSFKTSQAVYKSLRREGLPFTEDSIGKVSPARGWEDKLPKAALFASLSPTRLVMLDAAMRHPDLFEVSGTWKHCESGWNPLSPEPCLEASEALAAHERQPDTPSGYVSALWNVTSGRKYNPGDYKYVVVPLSYRGQSTSGRISLLHTAGAVVLMPRSTFSYDFSARFKPWVHYVPLSYSGADVVEKVRWLTEHDDLARQIAENARNFYRSYLRLEDHYCYAASMLELAANISGRTDVNTPFHPIELTAGQMQHYAAKQLPV